MIKIEQPKLYGSNGLKGLGGKKLNQEDLKAIENIENQIEALKNEIKKLKQQRQEILRINKGDLRKSIAEYERRIEMTEEKLKEHIYWTEQLHLRSFTDLGVYVQWLVRVGDDRIKESAIWELYKNYELTD